MTIAEAISAAKQTGEWSIVPHEPTSVRIEFVKNSGDTDETELDLYAEDKETELTDLWGSLCEEMESASELILSVYALGYVA